MPAQCKQESCPVELINMAYTHSSKLTALGDCTVQEPASTTKPQNARKLPAALAKKSITPQKEPLGKPSRSEKSQTPSKQRPSATKRKRKAINLLEDDDDDEEADFEVLKASQRVIYLLRAQSTPIPQVHSA